MASAPHPVTAQHRFERPQQHRLRHTRWLADNVHHVVHAVDEIHVGVSGRAVHDRVARRAAGVRMAGPVGLADIGLGLDDAAGQDLARPAPKGVHDAAHEQAAEEFGCNFSAGRR